MDAIIDLIPPKIAAYLPLSNAGYVYASGAALIDFTQPSLWLAVASILFNPTYWNITARNEYRNHTLAKALGGPYAACYFFTVTIFSLGILRDHLYQRALIDQPHFAPFAEPAVKALAVALFVTGQVFVVTSIYALGITGTYLGDYCGILMKERVTCFPFNVLEDPMYVGSAMAFLGTALWYESLAGVAISALVWVVYAVALKYEGPFTAKIYSNAAAKKNDDDAAAARTAAAAPAPAKPAAIPEPPSTPRKSSRIAATAAATATTTSAQPTNGISTPRRKSSRKSLAADLAEASPMRVTRSRSKAPKSDDESN